MNIPFETLPAGFCGFRILHLSDLHIDGIQGLAERVADLIAPHEVDLCVFTGDYRFATSGTCHNVYPEMRKIVRAVRSRNGILGILGNHDYAEEIEELEAMGIRMLMNASVECKNSQSSIWVAGLDTMRGTMTAPIWIAPSQMSPPGLSEFCLPTVPTPSAKPPRRASICTSAAIPTRGKSACRSSALSLRRQLARAVSCKAGGARARWKVTPALA